MGLKVSANTFQLCMDQILANSNLSYKTSCCYIDDILLYHTDFDNHMRDLNELLQCLKNAGLKLNPKKCVFAVDEIIFLGNKVSSKGIEPPDDKISAVKEYPLPRDAKELKRFLSFMGWFRKFIDKFSIIAFPLNELLKKGRPFVWTDDCNDAFHALKGALIESPVLSHPRSDVDYIIRVDASSKGIGYMLYYLLPENESQGLSERERVRIIKFGSKTLKPYQRNYSPCKLELLGVTTTVTELADYIRGRPVKVLCDHQALRPLLTKQTRGPIFSRWAAIMQQFQINIEYLPAEEMVVPDALSRCQTNTRPDLEIKTTDSEPHPFFPYVDEPSGNVKFPNGQTLDQLLDDTSKNEEPYPSDNLAASIPISNRFNILANHDDQGYDADTSTDDNDRSLKTPERPRKMRRTRRHQQMAPPDNKSDSVDDIPQGESTHIAAAIVEGNLNNPVTMPTNNGSNTIDSGDTTEIYFNASENQDNNPDNNDALNDSLRDSLRRKIDSINQFQNSDITPDKIRDLQHLDTEILPMIEYLSEGLLPQSQKACRLLLIKSADYMLVDGVLFHKEPKVRKSNITPESYQLVVPKVMQRSVIQIYHDSLISGHAGIQITIDKLRRDFFFEKMCTIVTNYVKSCDACQKRKIYRHTKNPVTVLPTPSCPFEAWQLDIFGDLPITSQGHCYIFVATDMFSRYQYSVPLRSKDSITVSHALFNLCCTFGTPRAIHTDLGTEFTSSVSGLICELLGITQKFAPAFCHFVMGKNERTHLDLARRLTPFVQNNRADWDKHLNAIVFSMNSSIHSTLGFSPFELVYGMKPRFPLSNPIQLFDISSVPQDYQSYIKQQRSTVEKIREQVKLNTEKAHAEMIRKANAQTHAISVEIGDYVYLAANSSVLGSKLNDKFEGPFVIHEIISPHMVKLRNPDSGIIKDNIHLNRLKPAHVRINDPEYAEDHPELFPPLATRKLPVTPQTLLSVQPPPGDSDVSPVIPRRSNRPRNPNITYCDPTSSDSGTATKVKKYLGRRVQGNTTYYLVQPKGESSAHAAWKPMSQLNAAARAYVITHPPPLL